MNITASHSWSESKKDISLKMGRAEKEQRSKVVAECVLIRHLLLKKKIWAFTAKVETSLSGEKDKQYSYFTSKPALSLTQTICIWSSDSRHKVILSCPVHICNQKSLWDLEAPHNKSILQNCDVFKKKKVIFSFSNQLQVRLAATHQILLCLITTNTYKTQQGEHMQLFSRLFPAMLYHNRRTKYILKFDLSLFLSLFRFLSFNQAYDVAEWEMTCISFIYRDTTQLPFSNSLCLKINF